MSKRLFLAINLPFELRAELEAFLEEAKNDLPSEVYKGILPSENWHITLEFLGDQKEEDFQFIKKAAEKVVSNYNQPEVQLQKIVLGPKNSGEARMLWCIGSSPELNEIVKDLDFELREMGFDFEELRKDFLVHITLARFKLPVVFSRARGCVPPLPKIQGFEADFDFKFKAKSLDLMESVLDSNGSKYYPIFQIDFKSE